MGHILVTNDDGIDSPALVPLVNALGSLRRVEALVPDRERSWISKAVTRFDEIDIDKVERDGTVLWSATGYPADCAQIGIHSMFGGKPELVVSGINIGFNFGAAYILSSGTIGAATEAWISGVPAIALSAGTSGDWPAWARFARSAASSEMWARLADVATSVVSDILGAGFPAGVDLFTVNIPEQAGPDTRRVVTGVARVGYDRLFAERGRNRFAHDFGGDFVQFDDLAGSDVAVARSGMVAITPIRVHQAAPVTDELRRVLER